MTESAFFNSIHNLVRHSLLEKIEPPSLELTPSTGIGYLLNFMTDILSVAGLDNDRQEFIVKVSLI